MRSESGRALTCTAVMMQNLSKSSDETLDDRTRNHGGLSMRGEAKSRMENGGVEIINEVQRRRVP